MRRAFLVAALGNYTHPHTRHSVRASLLAYLPATRELIQGRQIGLDVVEGLASKAAYVASLANSGTGSAAPLSPGAAFEQSKKLNGWLYSIDIPAPLKRTPPDQALRKRVQDGGGKVAPPPVSPPAPSTPELVTLHFFKPRALMNVCGQPVSLAFRLLISNGGGRINDRALLRRVVLVQDDVDLPAMRTRLKAKGSGNGHNGVRSVQRALGGASEMWQLRIGIGRPDSGSSSSRAPIDRWVLGKMSEEEREACSFERGGKIIGEAWEALQKVILESR